MRGEHGISNWYLKVFLEGILTEILLFPQGLSFTLQIRVLKPPEIRHASRVETLCSHAFSISFFVKSSIRKPGIRCAARAEMLLS